MTNIQQQVQANYSCVNLWRLSLNFDTRCSINVYLVVCYCEMYVQAHKICERVHDINLLGVNGETVGKVSFEQLL